MHMLLHVTLFSHPFLVLYCRQMPQVTKPKAPIRRGVLKPVPSDGNCLFHALILAVQLLGVIMLGRISTWRGLKSLILGLFKQHQDELIDGSDMTWTDGMRFLQGKSRRYTMNQYVEFMKHEWGG